MTRITNADQVLLLLRSHLQRTQRGERKSKSSPAAADTPSTPLERVQALARQEDLPRREIARALVGGLLTNEFGPAASNDAEFQAMMDDVLGIIERDVAMSQLLDRAVQQLLGKPS